MSEDKAHKLARNIVASAVVAAAAMAFIGSAAYLLVKFTLPTLFAVGFLTLFGVFLYQMREEGE